MSDYPDFIIIKLSVNTSLLEVKKHFQITELYLKLQTIWIELFIKTWFYCCRI